MIHHFFRPLLSVHARSLGSAALALAALLPAALAAGEPWDDPAFTAPPAELAAAAAEIEVPEGANVHVLLFEMEYQLSDSAVTSHRERQVYRVLTTAGAAAWASLEVSWSPWYQDRPEIRARVIAPDGRVHELDPTTVAEAAAAVEDDEMFGDERLLRAPLPAVVVGSVVEAELVVPHVRPLFEAGVATRRYLALGEPGHRVRLILDAPAEAEFPFRAVGVGEPVVETYPGRVRRIFERTATEAVRSIPTGLPPDVPLAPYVAFTTGSTWSELARAYSDLVDRQIAGSDLSALSAGEGAESQWERMAQLLAAVHRQVRYTGVALDDAGIVPRPPAETLARRFGDCKDKAVLLTALLRREGVPAYVALLRSGWGPDAEPELPGLGLFNHAIVFVPGAEPLWIDPTDPHSPLGSLPLADQGRFALVAAPNTRDLSRTPEAESRHHRVSEQREVFLAEVGHGRIVETSETTGSPAGEVRAHWSRLEREELSEHLEEYVEAAYGATLAGFEHSLLDDPTPPLEIRLEADEAEFAVTDLTDAALLVPTGNLFDRLPDDFRAEPEDDESPREHDYLLYEPHQVAWRYVVHLPPGLTPRDLPEDREERWGPARYTRTFEVAEDGRQLVATFELDTGARRYTAEDLAALRRGLSELDEATGGSLILWFDQTVERHLAADDVRAAVAEARRLIELHPEHGIHHAQLARALLAGGLGEAAREASLRGTQVEPELATGWVVHANVLAHDLVGRLLSPGFDRAGAEAAYRRALELEPDDAAIQVELAVLLEHDAKARRYAPEAALSAAIDLYRQAGENTPEDFRYNLPIALLRADRMEELEEEIERLGSPPELISLELAAKASIEDADAAVAYARRQLNDSQQRLEALLQAGQELLRLGRYRPAAGLARAAMRVSPKATSLLPLIDMLEAAAEPAPPIAPDAWSETPEALVRRLVEVTYSPGSTVADTAPLYSELVRERIEEKGAEPTLDEDDLYNPNLPISVLRDLVLASTAIQMEGEPEIGFEVRTTMGVGADAVTTTYLVTSEEGGYRIVTSIDAIATAGLEVLRRVERGELEAAEQWLEWIADHLRPAISDDPLSGSLMLRFWKPGEPLAAARLRLAAAALLCSADAPSDDVVEILEQSLDQGVEPVDALHWALAQCRFSREEWDEVYRHGRRLVELHPGSELAFRRMATPALEIGGEALTELERVIDGKLERDPREGYPRFWRGEIAETRGDLQAARAIYAELIGEGLGNPFSYNAAAWMSLFLDESPDRGIEWASEGVQRSEEPSTNILHTLATLLAEKERAPEALQVLLQSMGTERQNPASHDWLVLGRLAELYGLPDVARDYYRRVEPSENPRSAPQSSYVLAQRRLAALEQAASATVSGMR